MIYRLGLFYKLTNQTLQINIILKLGSNSFDHELQLSTTDTQFFTRWDNNLWVKVVLQVE
jgi:hypothetical protein